MSGSRMLGLRVDEAPEFLRFFSIVQSEAKERGKAFFVECGEGHEATFGGINAENLSGWLVPLSDADEFDSIFQLGNRDRVLDEIFPNSFARVEWARDGDGVSIEIIEVG